MHIRIKQGNDARYIPVPMPQKLPLDHWQGKENAWVKNSHPFAFEINDAILEIQTGIFNYIKEWVNYGKPVILQNIVAHMTNKGDNKSFLEFMAKYFMKSPKNWKLTRSRNTERTYPIRR